MKPWERQPQEGTKAFDAFRCYLEMGSYRTLEAVSQQLSRSVPFIKRWSARWDWVGRTTAYADHIAGLRDKAEQKVVESESEKWARRREQLREQEHRLALELIKKAEQMLQAPLSPKLDKDTGTVGTYARWTMADAARYVETASKLARLAAGMETTHSRVDVTDMTIAARTAFERLRQEFPDLAEDKARIWVAEDFGVEPQLISEAVS
jgi:hypothetical protein